MKRILVIGIGTGNPEHLTIQAIKALNSAAVLWLPEKGEGKEELADIRRTILDLYLTNPDTAVVPYSVPRRDKKGPYRTGVDNWHDAIAQTIGALLAQLPQNATAGMMVWGDPSLYDSTLRILGRLNTADPFTVDVIPGITAPQALTAAHAIPLNRIGEPVLITTGRKLRTVEQDTVVMLDGQTAFLDADPDLVIFWGAYLGTRDELLVSGRLGAVRDEIVRKRAEARERHGWIMDTYLLRKMD